MLRRKARATLTVAVLYTAWLVACGCVSSEERARESAEIEWRKHERIVDRATQGKDVTLDELKEANRFFVELTGIRIPLDHSAEIEWLPTSGTTAALTKLRSWHKANHGRMRFDSERKRVVLTKPSSR